jgi:phosphoribosyl-ATP pyrophosphohydrolase/phosphoribosyl-AMP cyclohydrolase/histidinol dehydrogenase
LPAAASYYVLLEGSDVDSALDILDGGASKVIIPRDALALVEGVDASRVLVTADQPVPGASGIYTTKDVAAVKGVEVFYAPSDLAPEMVSALSKSTSHTLVLPTASLSLSPSSSLIDVTALYTSTLISDRPDGLFPTVVTSYTSGRSLGLVYSSTESIAETLRSGRGVYQSRKHGLWRKGETSGATQEIKRISYDCDHDALQFEVIQHGSGFCHLPQPTCFGQIDGLAKLESTLQSRMADAPEGSYTQRLFTDEKLLRAKILEEAQELCDAQSKEEVAFEAADLVYFALARCISKGVSLREVEDALDRKSLKVKRRKGDAKPAFESKIAEQDKAVSEKAIVDQAKAEGEVKQASKPSEPVPSSFPETSTTDDKIQCRSVTLSSLSPAEQKALLLRPVLNSLSMIDKVKPIVERVRVEGDAGLKSMTAQFDRCQLESNVLLPPFATPTPEQLPTDVREAIDVAYENVRAFHAAQVDGTTLKVETMPGVVCSRFARPIARVGIYVPGGTAILPSTAIMLGVPAQVAGCKEIVLATPPRPDGSISPEVLYVAKLAGVTCILKAGGAQAVAAMAYGTDECPKVDKIFGPGNQWVTAAKMLVQNDTEALVGIDMPAGPSEVLVRILHSHRLCTPVSPNCIRISLHTGHCRLYRQPRIRRIRPSLASRTRHRLSSRAPRHRPLSLAHRIHRSRDRQPSARPAPRSHRPRSHRQVAHHPRRFPVGRHGILKRLRARTLDPPPRRVGSGRRASRQCRIGICRPVLARELWRLCQWHQPHLAHERLCEAI